MRTPRFAPIALLALAACAPNGPNGDPSVPMAVHYEDRDEGWSINVPTGWGVRKNDVIVTDDADRTGVAFVMPAGEETTTLIDAKFHVGFMSSCETDGPSTITTATGAPLERITWMGAGAGNLYEGVTYKVRHDGGCHVLDGYIHSCNLGADCASGHADEFDRAAIYAMFDAMARTFEPPAEI